MARPPKAEHEQRRHEVKFLLTDAELAALQQAARESSIHALARTATVDGRITIRQRSGLPFSAVHQSNRLGVVLRQVCDHAETHGEPKPPFDQVRAAIKAVFDYAWETTVQAPGLDDGKRPHRVRFRLSDDELHQVRAAAEALKLSVNDYARYCTTGTRFYELTGDPFPAEAINDLRIQGRAIWQALGHSRATGAPLPSFDVAARILEGIYHTVYLPRLS